MPTALSSSGLPSHSVVLVWGLAGETLYLKLCYFPFSDFLFSFMCCLFGLCLKLVSCPPVFMESGGSFGILQCVAGPFNRYFLAFIYPAFLVPYVSFQHYGHNFTYLNIFLSDLISHKPPKGIKSEFQETCLCR